MMLQGPDDPKIREDHVELSLLFLDLCEEAIEIATVRHIPFGHSPCLARLFRQRSIEIP
jgi:hypothetical protein